MLIKNEQENIYKLVEKKFIFFFWHFHLWKYICFKEMMIKPCKSVYRERQKIQKFLSDGEAVRSILLVLLLVLFLTVGVLRHNSTVSEKRPQLCTPVNFYLHGLGDI